MRDLPLHPNSGEPESTAPGLLSPPLFKAFGFSCIFLVSFSFTATSSKAPAWPLVCRTPRLCPCPGRFRTFPKQILTLSSGLVTPLVHGKVHWLIDWLPPQPGLRPTCCPAVFVPDVAHASTARSRLPPCLAGYRVSPGGQGAMDPPHMHLREAGFPGCFPAALGLRGQWLEEGPGNVNPQLLSQPVTQPGFSSKPPLTAAVACGEGVDDGLQARPGSSKSRAHCPPAPPPGPHWVVSRVHTPSCLVSFSRADFESWPAGVASWAGRVC